MGYDAPSLVILVERILESAPLTTLAAISKGTGIGRHTFTRALRGVSGVTFREKRTEVLRARVEKSKYGDTPRTIKEIAFDLGYRSANSLSRRMPGINGRRRA